MIYFIQDTSTNEIKIGYTDGEPANRLRQLQTGNPAGLVLLAWTEGDKEDESELHERFKHSCVRGEWFKPSEDVLKHILATTNIAAYEKGKSESPLAQRTTVNAIPLEATVYMAGKISKNCWRHRLVPAQMLELSTHEGQWSANVKPFWESFRYAGPYFVGGNHGLAHGDDTHGMDGENEHGRSYMADNGGYVHGQCTEAIEKADLIYAWINELDCYGTIAELGYAYAIGKQIWIAGKRQLRDLWFVYRMANFTCFSSDNPSEAFSHLWGMYLAKNQIVIRNEDAVEF